jgi:hypothetical protein
VNLGGLVRVAGAEVAVPPEEIRESEARCPGGYHIVAGGYQTTGPHVKVFGNDSFGELASWTALANNFQGLITGSVQAIAFCAPAGHAIAASAHRQSIVRTRINALIAAERVAQATSKK